MSFFRGLFAVVVMLGVAIISTGAFAAVPLTITHQGRLLDATDQPVNGVFDITYRIFEVPSGGSPLWIEVHPSVPVADGLFSALLGSTVPLSADVLGSGGGGGGVAQTRYLEISVGGTALAPRLALSSAPSAISAGHVSGDIETAPGQFTVTNNGGINSGRLRVLTTADSAISVLGHDSNGDGVPETSISSSCDASSVSEVMGKKGLNAVNVKLARMISSPPSGPAAADSINLDSDDDGVMDRSISSSVDGLSAKHAINTKGTGATHNRVVSVSSSTTEDSANSVCSMDLDGDGMMDRSVSSSVDGSGAKHAISTKGTGGTRVASVSSSTDESSASVVCGLDLDGDGVMDNTIADSVSATGARLKVNNIGSSGEDGVELLALPTGSSVAIKEKGTGADRNRITGTTNPEAATVLLETDLDGDGHPDFTIADSVSAAGASRKLRADNLGSSGLDGIELSVKPTGSGVAIKTKGTGADPNRVVSVSTNTDPSAASAVCAIDDDGDGVPESEISQRLTPTTSSVAIKTKGTGAEANRGASVSSGTSLSGASVACDVDLDGDGVSDNSVSQSCGTAGAELALSEGDVHVALGTRKGGMVKGAINITNGSALKVQIDSDGTGFFASKVGIGVLTPTEAISVAGGAYCDGTNWVNASDRNSKENFTAVDGNELLDQIAQLSITRWNYKGNNQAEHIGPTAQDFKAAFGVGADDRSISTIDPSGIALAAIKALNNKMQELNAETTQLEDQAREITQLRAELDTIKAMLQKQTATKN